MVMRNAMPKPTTHPMDARRPSTMELILSVTEAKVCPGMMLGGFPAIAAGVGRCCSLGPLCSMGILFLFAGRFQFRIRIADDGEVCRPRTRVQLAEQRIVPRIFFQGRD